MYNIHSFVALNTPLSLTFESSDDSRIRIHTILWFRSSFCLSFSVASLVCENIQNIYTNINKSTTHHYHNLWTNYGERRSQALPSRLLIFVMKSVLMDTCVHGCTVNCFYFISWLWFLVCLNPAERLHREFSHVPVWWRTSSCMKPRNNVFYKCALNIVYSLSKQRVACDSFYFEHWQANGLPLFTRDLRVLIAWHRTAFWVM